MGFLVRMKTNRNALSRSAWGVLGLTAVVAAVATAPLSAQTAATTTTTTTSAPVPVAPPPPAPVTTIQQTTVVTVTPYKLYLRKIYRGDVKSGADLTLRADGKVYDASNEYIGHLTNLSGDDVTPSANRDEFKIRNSEHTIIASTRPSSAFDSDRTITMTRRDAPAATTTTQQVTTTTTQP